ncbi:MAG: hypothetical protein ACLFNS_10900 [Desulfobacterales bacterium]
MQDSRLIEVEIVFKMLGSMFFEVIRVLGFQPGLMFPENNDGVGMGIFPGNLFQSFSASFMIRFDLVRQQNGAAYRFSYNFFFVFEIVFFDKPDVIEIGENVLLQKRGPRFGITRVKKYVFISLIFHSLYLNPLDRLGKDRRMGAPHAAVSKDTEIRRFP